MCGPVLRLGLVCAVCLVRSLPASAASAAVTDSNPNADAFAPTRMASEAVVGERWTSSVLLEGGDSGSSYRGALAETKRKFTKEGSSSIVVDDINNDLAPAPAPGSSVARLRGEGTKGRRRRMATVTYTDGGEDVVDDRSDASVTVTYTADGESVVEHDDSHDGHDHGDDHDGHDHGDHDGHDHSSHGSEARSAEEGQPNKPWGEVILATFIINVLTLVGIVVLAPGVGRARAFCFGLFCKKKAESAAAGDGEEPTASPPQSSSGGGSKSKKNKKGHGLLVDIAIPAFAAGALLAAAVFLILPEAIVYFQQGTVAVTEAGHDHRLLQDGHEGHDHGAHGDDGDGHEAHGAHDDHGGEAEAAWKFGASVLGGFLLPMVLGAFFPRASAHECDGECGENPHLRDNPVADALIPPESLRESRPNDHCCCCEVAAMERRAAKAKDHHPETHPADEKTHVSNCPSCDEEEACCCSRKGVDRLGPLDESGYTKGMDESWAVGESCCKDKGCCKGGEDKHDHDVDLDAESSDVLSSDDHAHEKFHDETDHTSFSAGARARRLSVSIRNSIVDVCKHNIPGSPRRRGPRVRQNINYRMCCSILVGDAFHNYADGVFIGIAYMLCTRDVAISIMAITLYHEVAQELADFFLLTRHAGLGVMTALFLNFLSGMSVMLGGITILAVDLTAQSIGVVLCISAGVYVQIAASECIPRVDGAAKNWRHRVLSLVMFVVGAVPIGLTLINHQHCEG